MVNQKLEFSVAPMMKWTDHHCRFFHRLMTKKAFLYSEMISADALVYGPTDRLLYSNKFDEKTIIQIGGSNPDIMAKATYLIQKYGFKEVNLNIGCPSSRVQAGNFGACLMETPNLVVNCIKSIQDKCHIPISVKCRIGTEKMNDQNFFDFIDLISRTGVKKFVIHARKAILNGFNPKQNREIPPLNYQLVSLLKNKKMDLKIILNGGIKSIEAGLKYSKNFHLDGFMIGREAYQNPYILSEVDSMMIGKESNSLSRNEIAFKVATYIDKYCNSYVNEDFKVIRHILGLYNGMPGSKIWRTNIVKKITYKLKGDKIRFATDEIEKFICRKKVA